MIKTKYSKIISIFFAAIVVVSFSFGMMGSTVHADDISDLEAKIKALGEKSKKLDSDIKSLEGQIDREEEAQEILADKITSTESQIELYKTKIASMEKDIGIKSEEIDAKIADIEVNEELFSQRVRSMYIASTTSTLTFVLSAQNFSELLTRSEILRRISQSDTELIDGLKEDKAVLNAAKADMEAQNVELNATKASLDSSAVSLAADKKKSEASKASLEARQKKYMQDKQKSEKEIKANEAAIAKILRERASTGKAPEGAYKWPVPSSSRITSGYEWRTMGGKKEFHYGIDIGAKAGSSIVAAHDGTVIMVNKFSYGYGWHVVVDHGGGQATLYAHASRIDVSVGDKVTRGQTIAGVGTTGASTGNHLHFEVRINGEKVNPLSYVVAGS